MWESNPRPQSDPIGKWLELLMFGSSIVGITLVQYLAGLISASGPYAVNLYLIKSSHFSMDIWCQLAQVNFKSPLKSDWIWAHISWLHTTYCGYKSIAKVNQSNTKYQGNNSSQNPMVPGLEAATCGSIDISSCVDPHIKDSLRSRPGYPSATVTSP